MSSSVLLLGRPENARSGKNCNGNSVSRLTSNRTIVVTGKHVCSSETCACVNKIPNILKTLLLRVICFLLLKVISSTQFQRTEKCMGRQWETLNSKEAISEAQFPPDCRIFKTARAKYQGGGTLLLVEGIQRRASRFMVGKGSDLSYRDRLIKLRLLPLNYWLEYLDLVFFYKCLNNMVDFTFEFDHYVSFVQGRTTNYARTSLFRDYLFNRIVIIWNGIPEDIKVATTLCSFKRQLKSFYFKRLNNVFDGDNVYVLSRLFVPSVAV